MKMKKTTLLLGCLALSLAAMAQETQPSKALSAQDSTVQALSARIEALQQKVDKVDGDMAKQKKFKVSGYIQAQYQNGQEAAALKVGDKINEDLTSSYNRFGIRRGRIKFSYEEGIALGVFQLDITENGVKMKDAYFNVTDPWVKAFGIRLGVFDRPFGYEISYSSSRRESPERSTIFQTLFPDERDLGGMLIIQAPKTSPWSILKLEAGLFAGNGINIDTDSRKDFIGHLSVAKAVSSNFEFSAGVSYYNGGVFQGNSQVYTMQGDGFVLSDDPGNVGKYAKREYFGADAKISFSSVLGLTQLTGEYLFGQQPGIQANSKSPNSNIRPVLPTYIRKFSGGYVMLVQDLGRSPLSVVVKYDWYDPNTDVKGDEIGLNGTGRADVAYNTFGFGALWRMNKSLRLQAYYEIVKNETSKNLAVLNKDLKDNVFTLRLQYKF